jgi:RNA polymerase sigma factor (sigma-70 family)
MTDHELITAIKNQGRPGEQAIKWLFDRHKGMIGKARFDHRLTEEQALDAFTDAVLALRKQVMEGVFKGESKVSTYLHSIFYRRCVDQLRRKATYSPETGAEAPEPADGSLQPDQHLSVKEDFGRLMAFMAQLGEQCRQILMYRYYYGYEDMEEIARLTGAKNANTAGSLRYRCMQQLMKIIQGTSSSSHGTV